uniref:Transposase n=1 Tax=Schistosoma mansoni TaxID=6183 RepID=A0A5K4F8K9_SCHMA
MDTWTFIYKMVGTYFEFKKLVTAKWVLKLFGFTNIINRVKDAIPLSYFSDLISWSKIYPQLPQLKNVQM